MLFYRFKVLKRNMWRKSMICNQNIIEESTFMNSEFLMKTKSGFLYIVESKSCSEKTSKSKENQRCFTLNILLSFFTDSSEHLLGFWS